MNRVNVITTTVPGSAVQIIFKYPVGLTVLSVLSVP